jgi:hypothetical protein
MRSSFAIRIQSQIRFAHYAGIDSRAVSKYALSFSNPFTIWDFLSALCFKKSSPKCCIAARRMYNGIPYPNSSLSANNNIVLVLNYMGKLPFVKLICKAPFAGPLFKMP